MRSTQLPISWFIPLLLLLVQQQHQQGQVLACGMSTHNEVAKRAIYWFDHDTYPEYKEILEGRPSWQQPGTFFPDWGYTCGWNNEAEAAHWPQFLNYSAMVYRDTFTKPYNDEAKDVAAFLLGAVAHSVADISWHAIRVNEGTIEVMGDMEFFGGGDSHTVADTGGEFIFRHSADLDYIEPRWYIPSDFLINVYRTMNYEDVNPEIIELCMKLGFAGAWGNRIFGELLFPWLSPRTPFLVEFYENYFLGGLNDMAAWTYWCWIDFIRWLEEDGETQPWCKLEQNHWDRNGKNFENAKHEYENGRLTNEQSKKLLSSLGLEVVARRHPTYKGTVIFELVHASTGELFDPDVDMKQIITQSYTKKLIAVENEEEKVTQASCNAISNLTYSDFNTKELYSNLGSEMVSGDFNGDGKEDIVISSPTFGSAGVPQEGVVYILSGNQLPSQSRNDISDASDHILHGHAIHSRFGDALAIVDFNADGYDDLAVSSPLTNSFELFYDGRVDIYFGSASGLSSTPSITIKVDQPHPELPEDPYDTYEHKYTLLGYTLNSADVNGDGHADLLIGSPFAAPYGEGVQVGMAHVFFSSPSYTSGTVLDIHDDSDIELLGEVDYQWFGYSVVAGNVNGDTILLVGAPGHALNEEEEDEVQVVGRVYGYSIGKNDADLAFTITGETEFQRFGCFSLFGDFYLNNSTLVAIASPSEQVGLNSWQAGVIRVMDISELVGDVSVSDVPIRVTFHGSHNAAHLGLGGMTLTDTSLWISEPYYGSLTTRDGLERGRIYSFELGSDFPRGTVRNIAEDSKVCFDGESEKDRFGTKMLAVDVNGDGNKELIVSSVHSYSGGRLSGLVSILSVS